ncbi:phosphatase PAP2 family protein [Peribacillus sp. NPDC097295]|uniref:phosphatase PAP2 family protein n=1 Tax=Peribacillus sp. NPDC097295 TaxID=3364402 RepID=UPI00382DBDE7
MIKFTRVALLLICLGVFIMIMNEVQRGMALSFDDNISKIFIGVENTYWLPFFKTFTYLGSSIFIGCGSLVLVLYLWFRKKDYLAVAVVSIGVAGGDLLKRALKNFIHRNRPEYSLVEAPGFSFPSGHSMVGMIFFCMVAYFTIKGLKSRSLKWAVGSGFIFLVLLIGVSRIVLRVHFPSDVLAGFALGLAYGICCLSVYQWLKRKEGGENASP